MKTKSTTTPPPAPTSGRREKSGHDDLAIFGGTAHAPLAAAIARELGVPLDPYDARCFPDGELQAAIGPGVRGRYAVVVQPTARPAGDHLLELLFMADACRRGGARAVTAVVPYMGYARQDRSTGPGESLGMRVVAELLGCGHFHRIIAVDLHNAAIEGFLDTPLDHVSALPVLAEAVRPHAGAGAVIVSPDLGAVKRARGLARALDLPMAVVYKTRTSPSDVHVDRVIGDVSGMRPIVVDDMITTGGTIEAAAQALLAAGCMPGILTAVTHAVLVTSAAERLHTAGISRLVCSDSLPPPESPPLACEVVSLAPLLAQAVLRAYESG